MFPYPHRMLPILQHKGRLIQCMPSAVFKLRYFPCGHINATDPLIIEQRQDLPPSIVNDLIGKIFQKTVSFTEITVCYDRARRLQ
ncbi:hypothetical protein D3C81_790710 [compost metagenome]